LNGRSFSPNRTAFAAWVARGCAVLSQLAILLLVRPALPEEQFAVFGIVLAVLPWLMLVDLGIGATAATLIASNTDSPKDARGQADTALALSMLLAVAASLIWVLVALPLSGYLFRNLDDLPSHLGWQALAIAGTGFAFLGGGQVAIRILHAAGDRYLANTLLALIQLTPLVITCLWILAVPGHVSLIAAVAVVAVPLSLGGILLAITAAFVVGNRFRSLRYSWAGALLGPGVGYWLLNLGGVVVYNADTFIVALTVPQGEIARYVIYQRVVNVVLMAYGTLLVAYWPQWSSLIARKDWQRVEAQGYRILLVGLACLTLLAVALLASVDAAGWHGLTATEIIVVSVYVGLRFFTDVIWIRLLAAGDAWWFVRWVPFQAILSLSAQYLLSLQFGIAGLWAGMALSILATSIWLLPRRAALLAGAHA
jgi:O-antigen/teichoic acid export membrane protein